MTAADENVENTQKRRTEEKMTLNDGCTLTGTTLRPSSFAVVSPLLVLSVGAALDCARSALVREALRLAPARRTDAPADDFRSSVRAQGPSNKFSRRWSVARAHAEDNFHVGI